MDKVMLPKGDVGDQALCFLLKMCKRPRKKHLRDLEALQPYFFEYVTALHYLYTQLRRKMTSRLELKSTESMVQPIRPRIRHDTRR